MTHFKLFPKPIFKLSYCGESEWLVGPYIPGEGTPRIVLHGSLDYFELSKLNYPESFWNHKIPFLGTISWDFKPYTLGHKEFVPPEVAAMFPKYIPSRYTEDYSAIEVQGDFPQLIATTHSIQPLSFYKKDLEDGFASGKILWQGIGPNLTKDVFFTDIFPCLDSQLQQVITKFLDYKKVSYPSLNHSSLL
ncbi:hypothetical protein K9N68_37555 (plasmid) [Kovacikia minuta CCNUW1]|uniref:hypothetical protein n=1 Tax=Kovacikia minuta TaxID=2931930 RepID=UPI001CCD7A09|nr:hypothetical protein [Kovacikia minuta]UBF29920.1 hypothetical protein K9N68_37555 [Kovacikia minuta CCNUW1]